MPSLVYASVAGDVNKANDLYRQGKFDDSLKLYQEALDQDDKSSVVKYDLGTALYKKGDYEKALGYLEQAAQDKNIKIKPKAEYNLGNVLYKSGIQKENTNVDEAIKSLQEALGQYGQTIADDPKDQDAIFNQDFVKKEIERLKKKTTTATKSTNSKTKNNSSRTNKSNRISRINRTNRVNRINRNSRRTSSPNRIILKSKKISNHLLSLKLKNNRMLKPQAEENQKELDRKQAEDLLEEYQENEEPKKLLNYMPKKIDDRPVVKGLVMID